MDSQGVWRQETQQVQYSDHIVCQTYTTYDGLRDIDDGCNMSIETHVTGIDWLLAVPVYFVLLKDKQHKVFSYDVPQLKSGCSATFVARFQPGMNIAVAPSGP
jgi:hypothetical protein